MKISDLIIDSFFQITIHYHWGYASQTVSEELWLEIFFRSIVHVHDVMKAWNSKTVKTAGHPLHPPNLVTHIHLNSMVYVQSKTVHVLKDCLVQTPICTVLRYHRVFHESLKFWIISANFDPPVRYNMWNADPSFGIGAQKLMDQIFTFYHNFPDMYLIFNCVK